MGKIFLPLLLIVSAWSAVGAADVKCTTNSRGYTFGNRGWDEREARNNTMRDCRDNRYTDLRECERNMYCQRDDWGGGGYGRVWASPSPCRSYRGELCTTYVEFDMGNNSQHGVVTVEQLGGPNGEQIFACHQGRSPANRAPWIAPGQRYVFRLYAIRDCYSMDRRGRPVDQTTVDGI